MKFMLNSFLDSLPTKNNLSRWGKRTNIKCDLCGYKETLHHVLNNCKTMLDQGRYTWRHNSVLRIILDTLSDVSDPSWKFFCDLRWATKLPGLQFRPTSSLPNKYRILSLSIKAQSRLLFLNLLFLSSVTSILLMIVNSTNTPALPVTCENRVMTPSSYVLKFVPEALFQIQIRDPFNPFSPFFPSVKN